MDETCSVTILCDESLPAPLVPDLGIVVDRAHRCIYLHPAIFQAFEDCQSPRAFILALFQSATPIVEATLCTLTDVRARRSRLKRELLGLVDPEFLASCGSPVERLEPRPTLLPPPPHSCIRALCPRP